MEGSSVGERMLLLFPPHQAAAFTAMKPIRSGGADDDDDDDDWRAEPSRGNYSGSRLILIAHTAPPLDAMALAISVGDTHDTEGFSLELIPPPRPACTHRPQRPRRLGAARWLIVPQSPPASP
ncbi:hypothetical protein NQZ68_037163, partial [Dissostichus eleginoides]